LLSPLQWLEESRPDFYQDHIKPVLKGHFLFPGA
jgi:hypothetical protein